MAARKRGIGSIEDLYARSERRPGSSCWWWPTREGRRIASLWAFDHDAGEKRAMTAPRAVWNIVQGKPLGARIAFATCRNALCVNPAHNAAGSRSDMGRIYAAAGILKGNRSPAMMAAIARARAAQGIVETPAEIVLAIREAAPQISSAALARRFQILPSTVGKIRRGISRAGVAA